MSVAGAASALICVNPRHTRINAMSKEHEAHKEAKKKPALNPKERRQTKQAKKRERAVM